MEDLLTVTFAVKSASASVSSKEGLCVLPYCKFKETWNEMSAEVGQMISRLKSLGAVTAKSCNQMFASYLSHTSHFFTL